MIKTTPDGIRYTVTLTPESYSTILTALLLLERKRNWNGDPDDPVIQTLDYAVSEILAALDEKPLQK